MSAVRSVVILRRCIAGLVDLCEQVMLAFISDDRHLVDCTDDAHSRSGYSCPVASAGFQHSGNAEERSSRRGIFVPSVWIVVVAVWPSCGGHKLGEARILALWRSRCQPDVIRSVRTKARHFLVPETIRTSVIIIRGSFGNTEKII